MATWLLIERLENWRTDAREGFTRFGIPASKAPIAEKVQEGDRLIFYTSSPACAFSHVRIAAASGLHKLGLSGEYDTAYAFALQTRPLWVLPRRNWIRIRDVQNALELTRGQDLRRVLRTSIKKLSERDGNLLASSIAKLAQELGVEPVS